MCSLTASFYNELSSFIYVGVAEIAKEWYLTGAIGLLRSDSHRHTRRTVVLLMFYASEVAEVESRSFLGEKEKLAAR